MQSDGSMKMIRLIILFQLKCALRSNLAGPGLSEVHSLVLICICLSYALLVLATFHAIVTGLLSSTHRSLERSQYLANMTQSLHSLHVGEAITLVLGFGISTLAVCARIYTKKHLTRTMMSEDYLSLLAWFFFLAYVALAVVVGKKDGSVNNIAYISSIEATIYCPIIVIVKISILLQYITVFVVHRGSAFHYTVHGLIWANVIYYTIVTFLHIFHCTPRPKLWDPIIPGHCLSNNSTGVASGIINVISDFSILVLPFPIIWRLQMPWHKKSRVIAVFGVGLFACIASVFRLVYSSELSYIPRQSPNYQLDDDRVGLWALAEIAIGIIVGCLPVLPRFFTHFASKGAGSSSRFKILSSVSRASWRRLFRKSTSPSPEPSRRDTSYFNHKFRMGKNPWKSNGAPYIETLNLTSNSLEFPEKAVPRTPSPVHSKRASVPAAAQWVTTSHAELDEYRGHGRITDVERAIPPEWK